MPQQQAQEPHPPSTSGDNAIICRDVVPWSSGHPRHDHQMIFALDGQRLLMVWCEYYVTRPSHIFGRRYEIKVGDEMPCRISAKVSVDRGRSWSETFTFQDNLSTAKNVKHPNLIRTDSGDLLFFFTAWHSNKERSVYLRRSKDSGETWSDPEKLPQPPGFNMINNDHVFRMKSGRIILPTFNTPEIWTPNERLQAFCFYSDDQGQTWQQSCNRIGLPKRGAEEPTIVELKDGRLLIFLRSSLGTLFQAFSTDGGGTWSDPVTTGIMAPAAPPLLKRIPQTGDLLLVWNHSYDAKHHHQGDRTPLSSAISKDDGLTWGHVKNIEVVPGGSAAYAAVFFQADEALVTYYYQPQGMGSSSDIRLKIIPIEWFYR